MDLPEYNRISIEPYNCLTLCPHHGKCCKISTEIISFREEVRPVILFVGQGGGETEERTSRPFVGKAGKRMRQIMVAVWDHLGRVFTIAFSNTVRCRPTTNGRNRVPNDQELECCLPNLEYDIRRINPRVIVPLGMSATTSITSTPIDTTMAAIHGRYIQLETAIIGNRPWMPTYHPSYLVRTHGEAFDPRNMNRFDQILFDDILQALKFAHNL